ncbi:GNAT family N-acetyltransferase [Pseudonocardia zijingensis]|uniref:GNAT family N-acetyltransferase n=1 Tax=Pseudonocardia zijingensis TaxID=153376 RepID=A0ABN1QUU6_9PSEU
MVIETVDVDTAVHVLTRAFADDPVARWLLPEERYGAWAARVFGRVVQASAEHGKLAVTAGGTAVAVWLRRPADGQAVEEEPLPPELARLATVQELTADRHPAGEPYLYLAFLGVVPGERGRGLGGDLLRHRLDRADAEDLPAYLEASSARSRELYLRYGFRDAGDPIPLPDGPVVRPMRRNPRP